jgi:hypothetical protein
MIGRYGVGFVLSKVSSREICSEYIIKEVSRNEELRKWIIELRLHQFAKL